MSYTNIVWIKVFLSLFDEDERFLYHLNESQQLLFIKMLYLAAKTQNEIPKNSRFICAKINYSHDEDCLFKDLSRIMDVFRGLKSNDKCFYFKNFHKFHNYIRNSQGTPKECPSIAQDKDKDKEQTIVALKYFYHTYEKMINAKCVPHWAKDGALVKGILGTLTLEEFKAKVDVFFTLKDRFLSEAGYTVGVFSSYINKITPKPKGRGDV